VGRRWAANEWSVAQEHVATSICEDVLAADIDAPVRGTAVVTRRHRGVLLVVAGRGAGAGRWPRMLDARARLPGRPRGGERVGAVPAGQGVPETGEQVPERDRHRAMT
jgi:hypothetical protein